MKKSTPSLGCTISPVASKSQNSKQIIEEAHVMYAKRSKIIKILFVALHLLNILVQTSSAQAFRRQKQQAQQSDNVVAEMQVVCHSDAIVLMVNTNKPFNGMLYAKDAPSSSNCVSEYRASTNMTFRLPLNSCATLSAEVDDGIEYFNTIVVQPHMRLMTNQGKGYHIRCKYQTRERTIANTHFNVSAAFLMQNGPQSSTMPILATASMPMCTMKIYRIDQDDVAESVKVGDKLVMVIEIDKQDMYGMRISNCVVRDGMNKAEQLLINDQGCPVDEAIMPKFEYEHNSTRAAVSFKAHKFPHTSSVYYQCNVRLCINNGGCDLVTCNTANDRSGNVVAAGDALTSSGSSLSSVSTNSSGVTNSSIVSNQAGPRRKRFATGQQQRARMSSAQTISGADDQQPEQNAVDGTEVSRLPTPSEQKSTLKSSQLDQAANGDVSFDVYSGLYVSDISDMAESNSGDPSGQQVLPARRNLSIAKEDGSSSGYSISSNSGGTMMSTGADSCLTTGKASFLVIVASLCSVALLLLIACQAGLLGGSSNECDQRRTRRRYAQPSNVSISSSTDLAYSPSPSHQQQQQRHHAHHHSPPAAGRHHQQHYPTALLNYPTNQRRAVDSAATTKNMSPLFYGLGLMFY